MKSASSAVSQLTVLCTLALASHFCALGSARAQTVQGPPTVASAPDAAVDPPPPAPAAPSMVAAPPPISADSSSPTAPAAPAAPAPTTPAAPAATQAPAPAAQAQPTVPENYGLLRAYAPDTAPYPYDGQAAYAAQYPAQVAASAQGQWVYTAQYGWIWIPAGAVTYAINNSPCVYLYTPTYGWTWYTSPWGWGRYSHAAWINRPWPYSLRAWTRGSSGWAWYGAARSVHVAPRAPVYNSYGHTRGYGYRGGWSGGVHVQGGHWYGGSRPSYGSGGARSFGGSYGGGSVRGGHYGGGNFSGGHSSGHFGGGHHGGGHFGGGHSGGGHFGGHGGGHSGGHGGAHHR